MAQSNYNSFIRKLEEIFMMDHAELDFGIYRIMNQKRTEIMQFLHNYLLPQVKTVLSANSVVNSEDIKSRIEQLRQQLGYEIDSLPESIPAIKEYRQLKTQLEQATDTSALENEVYSHLTIFFGRYYVEGDFVSKRRYKDNAYAIPYNGEEVKLYWANTDQYYIKTSEYFRNYSFIIGPGKKVHFVLRDATTEQNNNKAQGNRERRFALYQEDGQPTLEIVGNELYIYFSYELTNKGIKQDALMDEAFKLLKEQIPENFIELIMQLSPTEKKANRTLLEKHLTDYTAKNTFDYFIHKDLGGFLRRELDFYIKNEVLHIDDLDTAHVNARLALVKAIKGVGEKIITFLASLEDFQKKLWLKKKFVVQTDYCITLDRVPQSLYAEICTNEAQRKEWVRLFAIDEIKGDVTTEGYSEPLTERFLHQNPFLVLDTAFFTDSFKRRLVASMEHVDEGCNGLLINSENFQALELLQEKYKGTVKCAYYDPPYNTSEGSFKYKNNYKQSSWCSMIANRWSLTKPLLASNAVVEAAIDDYEFPYYTSILDDIFGFNNRLGTIAIDVKPSGRTNDYFLATSHEYLLCYANNYDEVSINFMPVSKEQMKAYKDLTKDGTPTKWRDFIRTGGYSTPEERPNSYYPIYFDPISGNISVEEQADYVKILPIDSIGKHRVWRKTIPSFEKHLKKGEIKVERVRGEYKVRIIDRLKEGVRPKSLWIGSKYDASAHGTKLIKNIFGETVFSFPKSLHTVFDSISLVCNEGDLVIDMFGGSGTTAHAVISANRNLEEGDQYKYIICEMGAYFNSVTKPRIQKVIYSSDWKDGKPISRKGISQCFKYIRLEQYEETLNNLEIKRPADIFSQGAPDVFKESYLLSYMIDTETNGSLFNLQWFVNPFDMTLKTTEDNELIETRVDMVETFNYLIGLNVETIHWHERENICVVEGVTHQGGERTLVIWRNCLEIDNERLNRFFEKMDYRTLSSKYNLIYVNGDNTLQNLRRDDEQWKVVLIEEEFGKRTFGEE